MRGLKCSECGRSFPNNPIAVCENCFAPLYVDYNYDEVARSISPTVFRKRVRSLWRYFELLPIESKSNVVTLGEGFTPLKKCERLGRTLELNALYVKDDTVNPTYSFKDRPASIGVSKAHEFGFDKVGCPSTGNLAASTSAYAAKAGIECYIMVPREIERAKIGQALAYGARVVAVKGAYDDANRLAIEAADALNIAFLNVNIRSYYTEGEKTLAFEICEQLGWKAPDWVLIPMASGALFCAFWRGLKELQHLGFIEEASTRLIGLQPEGCSPIVKAFKEGGEIVPVENPKTLVSSLAIGNPASGYEVLRTIKECTGFAESVSDEEVLEGEKLLASTEGLYSGPASATTIAALRKFAEAGTIDQNETVVCLITECGLKAPDVLLEFPERFYEIVANIDAFSSILERGKGNGWDGRDDHARGAEEDDGGEGKSDSKGEI